MKVHNFECFIVVRQDGSRLEVHTVGASGVAMNELVGAIHETCEDLIERLLAAQDEDFDDDCAIVMLGKREEATGVAITNLEGYAPDLVNMLRDRFDAATVINGAK